MSSAIRIGNRRLVLSNLQKVLYPSGFTKGQVVEYYLNVADVLLPHLKGRALTLKRYPSGSTAGYFFEKRCPSHRPEWLTTVAMPSRREGSIDYCLIEDRAGLIWTANLASLELHAPLARAKDPGRPTVMAFDLDPGAPAAILDCARVGLRMREVFEQLGLKCVVKTSGGKGLHVYVPLNTPVTFEDTKSFSRAIATVFERENPRRITANMNKAYRAGRVFIDWSQNDQHKTTVCAYSLRAREQPSVSTPVTWEEVEQAVNKDDPDSLTFLAGNVVQRIGRMGDAFKPVLTLKQKLPRFS